MKVKQLVEFLNKLNPEATVVIHREVSNYGYGYLDSIKTGVFEETEYGNDFHYDQRMIVNPKEIEAVCLLVEDYDTRPKTEEKANAS